MKEFSSKDGGRYTFIDDVLNLQDLALAISSIFSNCQNFVIWGCELSGSTVSDGYVYINGRIRQFTSTTCSANSSGKRYLYESNKTETVPYASGSSKVGRTNYGVAIASSVPTSNDAVTGTTPEYIEMSSDGSCKRLKDAFFGLYSLLLDPTASSQTVKGAVSFEGIVKVATQLLSSGPIQITNSVGTTSLAYSDGVFYIQTNNGSNTCGVSFSTTAGITFSYNSVTLLTIKNGAISTTQPISLTSLIAGSIATKTTNIYNTSSATNTATIDINVLGYNGAKSYYRTTNIGNGKGTSLFQVIGSTSAIVANASSFTITGSTANILTLKGTTTKSDVAYVKAMNWADSAGESIGYLGYASATTYDLTLKNEIGAVAIEGIDAVNIGPAIKENGTLLSEKYVLKTGLSDLVSYKADSSNVYTKSECIDLFTQKNRGFEQLTAIFTKAQLRNQIEAAGVSDLDNYAKLTNYLSDMATSDAARQAIRNNIGAAATGEYQEKLKDTGWLAIGSTGLYARQIGEVVNIAGTVTTVHSGNTLFTLPSGIEAPTHAVGYTWGVDYISAWSCQIAANARECKVTTCNSHGTSIPFNITYIV